MRDQASTFDSKCVVGAGETRVVAAELRAGFAPFWRESFSGAFWGGKRMVFSMVRKGDSIRMLRQKATPYERTNIPMKW